MSVILSIRNLVKQFGSLAAVDGIDLDIEAGEFVALLGPSGCGKTTLLRMIGGFERPTSGEILLEGQSIVSLPANQRPINTVFQSYAVFPHMSVFDNIAYGLRVEKMAADDIRERVEKMLKLVHLSDFADRMPDKLSGGQRQRVALARSLAKQPKILLLDEPLSALDAKLRMAMQYELVRLQKKVGITFILVTHDQHEALSVADRAALLNHGKLCQYDKPHTLYENPANHFVADFIGNANVFNSSLTEDILSIDGLLQLDLNSRTDLNFDKKLLAESKKAVIRPEKFEVAAAGNNFEQDLEGMLEFKVQIEHISYVGQDSTLQVKLAPSDGAGSLDDGKLGSEFNVRVQNSRVDSAFAYQVGQTIQVRVRYDSILFLNS